MWSRTASPLVPPWRGGFLFGRLDLLRLDRRPGLGKRPVNGLGGGLVGNRINQPAMGFGNRRLALKKDFLSDFSQPGQWRGRRYRFRTQGLASIPATGIV